MSFRQMKTNELALILHGLQSVFVLDEEDARQKLIERIVAELAMRSVALSTEATGQ